MMTRCRWPAWLAMVTAMLCTAPVQAELPAPIALAEFQALHALICRQSGESRWMELDWHPQVWEARQIAAAEGKPLFIWAGSGGAPSAGC